MSYSKGEVTETELIAWAIPLIAEGSYSVQGDDCRRELSIHDETAELDFMEGWLLHKRSKQQVDAFKQAKESCTAENILRCCEAYLGPLGPSLAKQLEIPQFGRLVARIYEQERALVKSVGRILIGEREGISSEIVDRVLRNAIPEAIEVALVQVYAREMANLFPQLVERAAKLAVLAATSKPPREVQCYLAEATKCYLYGRFISCLIVCRGALEEAVSDLLERRGLRQEFNHVSNFGGGELARMIRFAKGKPIPGISWDEADNIRKSANKAAHGQAPSEEQCRSLFEDTRSVLLQIYTLIPS